MCIWLDVCFLAVGASVIATDAWLKWSIVRGDDIPIDRLVEINQAKLHLSGSTHVSAVST